MVGVSYSFECFGVGDIEQATFQRGKAYTSLCMVCNNGTCTLLACSSYCSVVRIYSGANEQP